MKVEVLDLLKTGQIIYIEDSSGQSRPFGVNNVLSHGFVVCQGLSAKTVPTEISLADTVTVALPDKNGAYLISANVVETDRSKGRIILDPTSNIDYVQRRQYFRISRPSVLVRYQLINNTPDDEDGMPVEGMAWDLSENGIGIILRSAKTIYTCTPIKIIISLPEEPIIEIIGEVVRVVPKSIIRNEYLLGIRFKNIKKQDRDKLVDFISQDRVA